MLITERQQVVVRSASGNQLFQWLPEDLQSLSWGRELRQVSKSSLSADSILDSKGNAPPIVPWLHWVDVYSTDKRPRLYWSGPIQTITMDEFGTDITAVDVAAYLARTRQLLTQSWNAVDPSVPALAMWEAMLEQKNLAHITPIQRLDPYGDRFDCNFTADEKELDKAIQDLEGMGLKWSVVAGVPIIGPAQRDPVATLGKADFIGRGISLTRDGSSMYNDILLRGADSIARGITDLYGLVLQTTVNVDNMFGLTNVNSAAQSYAESVGRMLQTITVPSGAVLDPKIDIDINQLIPSARFTIAAYGLRLRMELESLSVSMQSGQSQVGVSFTEVPDWTEIGQMLDSGDATSVQSGTRSSLNSSDPT